VTPQNKAANVKDEVGRDNEALSAARLLLKAGLLNDAVSRAYYAAYHWTSALLLSKGMEPKTHRGKIQLLSLHFVRTGLIGEDAAAHLSRLEDFREASDYSAAVVFSRKDAENAVQRAESFIEACKPLLSDLL
jgi:hypothetical protein